MDLPEYLSIEPLQGKLLANEEMSLTCHYTAFPDAPKEFFIDCELRVLQKLEVSVGTNYTQRFSVFVDYGYAELCVSKTTAVCSV